MLIALFQKVLDANIPPKSYRRVEGIRRLGIRIINSVIGVGRCKVVFGMVFGGVKGCISKYIAA